MGVFQNFSPVSCPSGCATSMPTFTKPACRKVSVLPIEMVYFSDLPFEDITDEDEWASRLSNTSNTSGKIRFIEVVASRPKSNPNTVKDEFGNIYVKDQSPEISWVDSDNSDAKFNLYNLLNCYPACYFWYKCDGKVYGGDNGIYGKFNGQFGISASNDSPSNSWDCKFNYFIQGSGYEPRVDAPAGV